MIEPEKIYTNQTINQYNTNVLTPLGQTLWETAKQKERTLNLDIREIDHQDSRITMQRISRALYGNTSAPDSYIVKINPIPETTPEKVVKEAKSWWSRFWIWAGQ